MINTPINENADERQQFSLTYNKYLFKIRTLNVKVSIQ